jgi:zinc finger SWIM domain-containing protein 3
VACNAIPNNKQLTTSGSPPVTSERSCGGSREIRDHTLVVNSPALAVNSPALAVNSPALAVNSPALAVNSPALSVNSPALAVNSPPVGEAVSLNGADKDCAR